MTEGPHHLTGQLSHLAKSDLPRAVEILQDVDRLALVSLEREAVGIWQLYQHIQERLKLGGSIYLVGCGATGRLALVLERLSRELNRFRGRIHAFMAGGDYALVRSVESFEDRTHYGERQLLELGFKEGDLLIAITEGGETPFVIGACEAARAHSSVAPWFVYCNPDPLLLPIARSRAVLQNPRVRKLNLTCGPMALTGSTRMQASTVQMTAVGLALLFDWKSEDAFRHALTSWREWQGAQDLSWLIPFIETEADALRQGELVTYSSDPLLAISILTDTTERAPTFSRPGFENLLDPSMPLSGIYLSVPSASDSASAWRSLLARTPHCLNWAGLPTKIDEQQLYGFDISAQALVRRKGLEISFTSLPGRVRWSAPGVEASMPVWGLHPFWAHVNLKMALNIHSTLMMGRLDFYLDNVMTWVRPSNNKLIDRATRYVQLLAARRGVSVGFEEGVRLVVAKMEDPALKGPVVLAVLKELGL